MSVSAGPTEFDRGLTKLRFSVIVDAGKVPERLDELLAPDGGVRRAIESTNEFRVIRIAGYQPLPDDHLGSTWTAEYIT